MVTYSYHHSHFLEQFLGLLRGNCPQKSSHLLPRGVWVFFPSGTDTWGTEQDDFCPPACVLCSSHEGEGGLPKAVAGGLVGKPAFHLWEGEWQVAPHFPNNLQIHRGDCYPLGLFLSLRRERTLGKPEHCHGRRRFIALSAFWVSSCPQPASERSAGLQSCPQLAGLERTEATLLALGQAQPECFGPSFPQALFKYPPSSAVLTLGTCHCVLGDSLAPNSPGNSG